MAKIIASATTLHEKSRERISMTKASHLSSQFASKEKIRLPSLSSLHGGLIVPSTTRSNHKFKYVADIAHLMPKTLNLDL